MTIAVRAGRPVMPGRYPTGEVGPGGRCDPGLRLEVLAPQPVPDCLVAVLRPVLPLVGEVVAAA
jgi:hypothetical protein